MKVYNSKFTANYDNFLWEIKLSPILSIFYSFMKKLFISLTRTLGKYNTLCRVEWQWSKSAVLY